MKAWMAQVLADDPQFAARYYRPRDAAGLPRRAPGDPRAERLDVPLPQSTGGAPVRDALAADPVGTMEDLCRTITEGATLADYCRERAVGYSWMHAWIRKDAKRLASYEAACGHRARLLVDEIIAIADELPTKLVIGKGGTYEEIDSAGVARNTNRIKARQWWAEKLLPKNFGARQTLAHTGDGGGPMQHRHVHVLTDAELEQVILTTPPEQEAEGDDAGT